MHGEVFIKGLSEGLARQSESSFHVLTRCTPIGVSGKGESIGFPLYPRV